MIYLYIVFAMGFHVFMDAAAFGDFSNIDDSINIALVRGQPLDEETWLTSGKSSSGELIVTPENNVRGASGEKRLLCQRIYHDAWQLLTAGRPIPESDIETFTSQIASGGCSGECNRRISDISGQLMLCEGCALLATFANRKAGGTGIVTSIACPRKPSNLHPAPLVLPLLPSLGLSVADDLETL